MAALDRACHSTGGDLSGASQPHKHLQLIPVEDDGPPVERLARKAKIDFPGRSFCNADEM